MTEPADCTATERNERNRRKRIAKKARKAKQRGEQLQEKQTAQHAARKNTRQAKKGQTPAKKGQTQKQTPAKKAQTAQSGGQHMPAPTPRRLTARTPQNRTVYEVAKRHTDADGKPTSSRPHLLEARTAAELAPMLASALGMDEPTSRAAALMLTTGAAIVSDTWQGQTVGRMEFIPARKAGKSKDKDQAHDGDPEEGQHQAQPDTQQRPASDSGEDQPQSISGE